MDINKALIDLSSLLRKFQSLVIQEMQDEKIVPDTTKSSFNCPHCGAFAYQHWSELKASKYPQNYTPKSKFDDIVRSYTAKNPGPQEFVEMNQRLIDITSEKIFLSDGDSDYVYNIDSLYLSNCYSCKDSSIWIGRTMIWPNSDRTFSPPLDLPPELVADYIEAAEVFERSPRAAAALLRLLIQKLMPHVGGKGKKIDDDIGILVENGLPKRVQKMLDSVRVIGNNAVHPGIMDILDNKDSASAIFKLVNLIVEYMITNTRQIDEIYDSLPQGARDAIAKRDN